MWKCCLWNGSPFGKVELCQEFFKFKYFNTLRPRQNGPHFEDNIFKCIFLNENIWMLIEISLKFVPKGQINDIPTLVQIMAWCRPGGKPLSEPMMTRSPTHICVTRPQWVNTMACIHDHLVTRVRCKDLPDSDRGDFRCRLAVAVFALRFENLLARNSSMNISKHEKEEKLAGPTGNFAGPAPLLMRRLPLTHLVCSISCSFPLGIIIKRRWIYQFQREHPNKIFGPHTFSVSNRPWLWLENRQRILDSNET